MSDPCAPFRALLAQFGMGIVSVNLQPEVSTTGPDRLKIERCVQILHGSERVA